MVETGKRVDISPAEWQVMRIVWTLSEVTSTTAGEILAQKVGWKSSTVKTLLRRLVKKGVLITTRKGRSFSYYPAVTEQGAMDMAANDFVKAVCQKRLGKILYSLLKEAVLSKNDIVNLQILLAEKAKTAPNVVYCNCLSKSE